MPEYKSVNITCYCGNYHPNCHVGHKVKCSCGITLRTQQRKNGDGHVWGELPGTNKRDEKYRRAYAMVQNGTSQLDAEFIL